MAGEIIELNLGGKRARGYVGRPEEGSGPGVLVIGAAGVINNDMTETADLYAEEGYLVLAPEVFLASISM